MAGPTTHARANWAHDRATSLPEVWATAAKHLGVVGAWRVMLVCMGRVLGRRSFWAPFRVSS